MSKEKRTITIVKAERDKANTVVLVLWGSFV